ncbi:MAG: hypothetical protein ACP5RV_12450 [Thiomonas sp.]
MADLTDVQSALVGVIAQTVYPNGTAQPSAVGAPVRVFPGWPLPQQLDADMAAGTVQISVFGTAISRAVPQMQPTWQTVSITPTQLSASVSGMTITLTGAITTPQAVSVQQASTQASYAVQASDTLTSICTALAALIPGATSSGNTLTLPPGATPQMLFAEPATVLQEVGRQRQVFQVSVWAPTPTLRAQVAALIDPALRLAYRLQMPDTSAAEIRFQGAMDDDQVQKVACFVRHLRYEAEYATTNVQQTTTVTLPVINLSSPSGALI